MCFSNDAPVDNSAAVARQQATEREGKVNEGKASIDKAFSVFDPAYYDKYKQTYLDNYNPEVDRQFDVAKQQTQYNLARAGTTDATIGQKQFGDLVRGYGQQKQNIASQAGDATNKLRTDVENEKTTLYGQNSASADPSLASISALSNANSLSKPGQFSPLGSVFAGLTNGISYGLAGANNKLPAGYANAFSPGSTLPGGNGSGKVVG